MIRKYLQQAHDCGFDVIIQFNYCCNARYAGKILDLDEKNFCLLHFGESHSMSWIFSIEDIKYMGIYKDNILPNCESYSAIESSKREAENGN